MGIFSLFSTKELDDFARKIAIDIARRYPPSQDRAEKKNISANRLANILERVMEEAVEFQNRRKLGWMGKAILGNAFRWELKELGYTDVFVEVATEGLIVYITKKQKQEEPPK